MPIGPNFGVNKGDPGHVDFESQESTEAGVKNKGKARAELDSATSRFEISGRLALRAIANEKPFSVLNDSPKYAGGSRNTRAAEWMLERHTTNQPYHHDSSTSLKSPVTISSITEAFDEFCSGSQAPLSTGEFHPQGPNWAVTHQEAMDGLTVANLLALSDDELGTSRQESSEFLSQEEIARLSAALFCPLNSQPDWERLLDFSPEFLAQPEALHEPALFLGTSDLATARSLWLQQWSDVFIAYNSQVWGDLAPLALQAEHEVRRETERSPSQSSETKALKRLGQILSHLRT